MFAFHYQLVVSVSRTYVIPSTIWL